MPSETTVSEFMQAEEHRLLLSDEQEPVDIPTTNEIDGRVGELRRPRQFFTKALTSFSGTERGTSSHCPECGHRMRPKGRWWKCTHCPFQGHRDLVGSANMHGIAYDEKITFPSLTDITYLRPGQSWEVSRRKRLRTGSSSRTGTGHGEGATPPTAGRKS